MSGPLSLPDDTIEFDVDQPSDRPVGLMIGIGVLTLLVLVGLGYLIIGNLTGGDGGSGVGLGGPGGPTAIDGPPSDSPSPDATDTAAPVPVGATTPATTPATRTPTPSASASTVAVSLAIVNGVMKPQSYTGPACPASTLAQATVVANGPVTITYHWNYAIDGKTNAIPPATYQFPAAGSHQFNFQPRALAEPSGKVTATFVVTAPITRRASMLFTQECGAKASALVLSEANPKCGDLVTLSSVMSAGVGPMQIGYRWQIPGTIGHPSIQPWDVPVGGGQQAVHTDLFRVSKGLTVTLTLDRISPPPSRDVSFQRSITLGCA